MNDRINKQDMTIVVDCNNDQITINVSGEPTITLPCPCPSNVAKILQTVFDGLDEMEQYIELRKIDEDTESVIGSW
jgi:hypothetical protein